MRPGGYTLQHVLTPEAAGLVKQAVGLAHRRGHAQVTPLHVANTMLSSSSAGLLRSACLHSHSHPLQCKALELCLNVALNRLPSSSSSTSSLDGSDWSLIKSGELTCCGDCSAKLDVEIRSNHGSTTSSPTTTSSFPSWLYKQENSTKLSTTTTNHDQDHIHQNKDPIIRSPSIDKEGHHLQRFKEFNTENLKSLSNSLERVVPWQSKLAPEIAGAVLQCRSGMTRADSMEDMKNKRTRYDKSSALLERFVEEVRFDPHRVFMVEDVEQVDYSWWLSLKRSIEGGKVCDSNGEEVSFGDAIVVLSCESFDSSSRACSLALKQKRDQVEEEMVEGEEGSFDLNLVVKDHGDEGFAFDGGVGLVEVVDRCFFFKLKEDL
ncbi:hypothetical protein QJS04_geneDACA011698 [Acorus gramineus]|uniref:Clp R domain-containing protein n=1 Tax=Acorus gramineus TaxID=55184 RepID=A0AAV9BFP1_ACOGR|nr:hypothetical protein QJS04_geneDACA011698 [Acorus gramineus]